MDRKRQKLSPGKVNESNDDVLDINSLPNEIILNVFGYLEQNQLGQIARVCRRWNVLTKSPLLWKKVNVKIFSFHRSQITILEPLINRLPSCVTSIRLDFSEYGNRIVSLDFGELCVKLQGKCPHLQELILNHSKLSNSLPSAIDMCAQFLQDVKNLVFHFCICPTHFERGEFGGTSKIEVLDLSWCDFGFIHKLQFSRMPYLKVLILYGTNIYDSWFLDDISFMNQLHVLNLGATGITAGAFPGIQNHGHNLKELFICGFYLHDHDFNFNNSLFPHLKIICLSGSPVTCGGVVSLIQSYPSLKNVYVDEDVAKSFAVHPFVVANRCKSGIVKAISYYHKHNVDYSHT